MRQSRTLYSGLDVHKDSIAVAYVSQEHGAAVTSLGTSGTRPCASASLLRKRPSKATQLIFVYAAGPCGSWLDRDLTNTGHDGWGVAPALMPQKAGDRVTTDRRDAGPLARLARPAALPVVGVPQVEGEAMRALTRARAATLSALKDAQFRPNAFWLRPDSRATGRATWSPAPLRWLSAVVCPTPAQPIVVQA
jgi:transposase